MGAEHEKPHPPVTSVAESVLTTQKITHCHSTNQLIPGSQELNEWDFFLSLILMLKD